MCEERAPVHLSVDAANAQFTDKNQEKETPEGFYLPSRNVRRLKRWRLTGHPVEEPLSSSVVGLQEFAVDRPVQVCDETGGLTALPDLHRQPAVSHAFIWKSES